MLCRCAGPLRAHICALRVRREPGMIGPLLPTAGVGPDKRNLRIVQDVDRTGKQTPAQAIPACRTGLFDVQSSHRITIVHRNTGLSIQGSAPDHLRHRLPFLSAYRLRDRRNPRSPHNPPSSWNGSNTPPPRPDSGQGAVYRSARRLTGLTSPRNGGTISHRAASSQRAVSHSPSPNATNWTEARLRPFRRARRIAA